MRFGRGVLAGAVEKARQAAKMGREYADRGIMQGDGHDCDTAGSVPRPGLAPSGSPYYTRFRQPFLHFRQCPA